MGIRLQKNIRSWHIGSIFREYPDYKGIKIKLSNSMKRTKHFKSAGVPVLCDEEFEEKEGKELILNTVFSSSYLKVTNQSLNSSHRAQQLQLSNTTSFFVFSFLLFCLYFSIPFFFSLPFSLLSYTPSLFHNLFSAFFFL